MEESRCDPLRVPARFYIRIPVHQNGDPVFMGRSIMWGVLGGSCLACFSGCVGGPAEGTRVEVAASSLDSFSVAFAAIEQRIIAEPGNAAHYAERAELNVMRDSLSRAIKDMERAVQLDSVDVDHRIRLGDLYYSAVRLGNARDQFNRAMEMVPTDTRPKLRLAEVQMVLREYAEGMALVNEALRLEPAAARGYYLKGYIHMETKDTNRAISSFRTAVEQDPQDYTSYIMLGQLSAARRDPLAEQYYSTALELRTNSVEAWYGKGIWAQNNGRDSLALACYERIKEIDPQNALAWHNSGWVKMEHLGDLPGAKADFSRALELNTGYTDAWYNRGVAMERSEQLDSAAANYQICLGIDPAHTLAANSVDRLARKGVRIKTRASKGPPASTR